MYKNASGMTSFKRHVRQHHKNDLEVLEKKMVELELIERERRPKKEQKTLVSTGLFSSHQPYSSGSEKQKSHDRDLVLLIAKASLPVRIVENPYFRRYVHGRNPRVRIPDRRVATTKLIPHFMKDCMETYVIPKLNSLVTVSITFNLWMSRRCEDIFDLVIHGMDMTFNQHQIHLKMVECNATIGVVLAHMLESELRKHNLLTKVIACVKDGGSNLRTCTDLIRNIVSCDLLDLNTCFSGPCFAHVLSNACNSALNPTLDSELTFVNSKQARSALQKCITWTKKSRKGREAWYASCRTKSKKERVMPTTVKTRFVSSVVMMSMMLRYREVVEHCFGGQEALTLRQRVPLPDTWEVIRVIVDTLEPIMSTCFISQKRNDWFLSDAVAKFLSLYILYDGISNSTFSEVAATDFERELFVYKKKLAHVLKDVLEPIIEPILSFRDLLGKYIQHYLSLVLHPEYKSLRTTLMKLNSVQEGRLLAKRYDDEVLFPILIRIYSKNKSTNHGETTSGTIKRELESEDAKPQEKSTVRAVIVENAWNRTNRHGEEKEVIDVDCFVFDENESEAERIKGILKAELNAFRREPFQLQKQKKMNG